MTSKTTYMFQVTVVDVEGEKVLADEKVFGPTRERALLKIDMHEIAKKAGISIDRLQYATAELAVFAQEKPDKIVLVEDDTTTPVASSKK